MSAPKKFKVANVQASVTERNDVKGKGKAIPPPVDTMDIDEPSEDDENSSLSESEGDNEDMADSGDSMDTEDEIELAQQPTKSKQTLSASIIRCFTILSNGSPMYHHSLIFDMKSVNDEQYQRPPSVRR